MSGLGVTIEQIDNAIFDILDAAISSKKPSASTYTIIHNQNSNNKLKTRNDDIKVLIKKSDILPIKNRGDLCRVEVDGDEIQIEVDGETLTGPESRTLYSTPIWIYISYELRYIATGFANDYVMMTIMNSIFSNKSILVDGIYYDILLQDSLKEIAPDDSEIHERVITYRGEFPLLVTPESTVKTIIAIEKDIQIETE